MLAAIDSMWGHFVKITPGTLVEASLTIGKLGDEVEDNQVFLDLNAAVAVNGLTGSPIADALAKADDAHAETRRVIASRFGAIAELLYTTARTFTDQDQALADQLARFGDMNSTEA